MNAQAYQTICNIASFFGAVIVLLSGIGIWYFGSKVDDEKQAKIAELISGKNMLLEQSNIYLADLRNKDAKITALNTSIAGMQPALGILEIKALGTDGRSAQIVTSATFPLDLREVDIQIEFTSKIVSASRAVVGSGTVQCNFGDPEILGTKLRLKGGPLSATNYLVITVTTEDEVQIRTHNLKKNP